MDVTAGPITTKGIPGSLCCVFLTASIQKYNIYLNGGNMQRKQVSDIFTFSKGKPALPPKMRVFPKNRKEGRFLGSLNTNKKTAENLKFT